MIKLVIDEFNDLELKKFLLSQNGITNAHIVNEDFLCKLDIEYNNSINPLIVLNYIELFCEKGNLISFDKGDIYETKQMTYIVEDMCCEYCYESLVSELYKNENIKSVKSNFDFHKPAFNIEFIIEYNKEVSKEEIIDYITQKNEG